MRVNFAAFVLAACVLLPLEAAAPAPAGPAGAPAKVLLLHSHYQGYAWTDAITAGVMRILAGASRRVDLSVAYLDSRRKMDSAYDEAFSRYLDSRFAGWRFDLILTADNEALSFVSGHRTGPLGGAPVVFCGVNFFKESMLSSLPESTGVTEEVDMLATVLAALRIRPDTKRVVVFECDNPTAVALEAQFRDEVADTLDGKCAFTFHRGLPLSSMVEEARALPADSIVILLNITRDADGNTIDPGLAANEISAASPVPVFSFWDFYFGHGIVGGRITSGLAQGEDAATLALRILAGEKASSIPVLRGRANPFVFDWGPMTRFSISERQLPAESRVLNRPDSFWARHALVLAVSGAIILVLTSFIVVLVILMARMRKARSALEASELTLRASLAEKDVLLREVHHRVNNNLQVMSSLLRLGTPSACDGDDPSLIEACRLRIETMALVHLELYDSEDFASIDMSSLVRRIAARLKGTWPTPLVALDLPDPSSACRLPLDKAVPLALIFDEALGNALRHAYPEGRSGRVVVSVESGGNGAFALRVKDDGVGHPAGFDPETSPSLGYLIMRALAAQLGARLDLDSAPAGSTIMLDLAGTPAPRTSLESEHG